MWTHLSRQTGGIGTRGPGETQLEVDRRRVQEANRQARARARRRAQGAVVQREGGVVINGRSRQLSATQTRANQRC
jgi:GTP-binding protein HflX